MGNWKRVVPLAGALVLAGCRIDIAAPQGGSVQTESGNYACSEGQSCSIEVEDTAFAETFTAIPDPDQLFAGWAKAEKSLCGGSLQPCVLDASVMAGQPALMALLESDEVFNLAPQFLSADEMRVYQIGDWVRFRGILSRSSGVADLEKLAVTAQLEFREPTYTLEGKGSIAARLTVEEVDSGQTQEWTVHFWQEQGGAAFQLSDEYGNLLLDTASNESGIPLVPVPPEPFDSSVTQYAIMWGGHTSGPIATGERRIEVGEFDTVATTKWQFEAYPISLLDEYTFLVTYDEFKRDQRVINDQRLWISQAKGLVKVQVTQHVFNENGRLAATEVLDLEFVRASF
jgi:hypothetical protein